MLLDFTATPVAVYQRGNEICNTEVSEEVKHVWGADCQARQKRIAAPVVEDEGAEVAEECTVPRFGGPATYMYDFPKWQVDTFTSLIKEYSDLFKTSSGSTTVAQHYIPTSGSPTRVPPRRIPAHYAEEVEQQIEEMVTQGIIEESSRLWMAPAAFVRK